MNEPQEQSQEKALKVTPKWQQQTNFLKMCSHLEQSHLERGAGKRSGSIPRYFYLFLRHPGFCGLQSFKKLQILLRKHPLPWWVCCIPLQFLQRLPVCKLGSSLESHLGDGSPFSSTSDNFLLGLHHSSELTGSGMEKRKLSQSWFKFYRRHLGEEDPEQSTRGSPFIEVLERLSSTSFGPS